MECHPKIIYYILSCAQCPGMLTLTGPAENIGMVEICPNQIFKKIVLLFIHYFVRKCCPNMHFIVLSLCSDIDCFKIPIPNQIQNFSSGPAVWDDA